MTTITKLALTGVRSFSPYESEKFEFDSPLTVITGHNGAGKTTIVEALKMACTGELPPNANRGHNFIHDPELANTSEVKGQIRVVFRCAKGNDLSVHRNMQLTRTIDRSGNPKMTFKQLEAAIAMRKKDGTRVNITSRCVDIDSQIPGLMGVPRSVLENVVFVHQEESYWPLGDMQKLKKKFDDLFGATQYTKAVTQLLTLKKEMARRVKDALHDSEITAELHGQCTLLTKKITDAERKQNTLRENQTKDQEDIGTHMIALERLQEEKDFASEARRKLQNQEQAVLDTEKEVKSVKSNLGEAFRVMNDSLEALEQAQSRLLSKRFELRASASETSTNLKRLDDELDRLLKEREELSKSFEELTAVNSRIYDAKERSLALLSRQKDSDKINDASLLLSIPESCEGISPRVLAPFVSRYEECLRDHDTQVEQDTIEISRALNMEKQRLDKAKRELVAKERQVALATTSDQRISEVQSRITKAQASVQEDEKKLQALEVDYECLPHLQAVPDASEEREALHSASEHVSKLESEQMEGERNVDRSTQSRVMQDDLQKCRLQWNEISENVLVFLQKNFGKGVNEEFCSEVKNLLRQGPLQHKAIHMTVSKAFQEAQTRVITAKAQAEAQEGQRADLTRKVDDSRILLNRHVSKIEEISDKLRDILPSIDILTADDVIDEFETILNDERATVENRKKNLLMAQNADTMYNSFFSTSKSKNVCAFCSRPFEEGDLSRMEENLASRLESLPKAVDKCTHQYQAATTQFTSIESLRTEVFAMRTVMAQRDSLQKEVDDLTKQNTQVSSQDDGHSQSEDLSSFDALLEWCDELKSVAETGKRLKSSLNDLHSQWGRDFFSQKNDHYESALKKIKGSLHSARVQRDQLSEKVSTAEQAFNAFRQAEAQASKERERLTTSIAQLKERISRSMSLIDEWSTEIQSLQTTRDPHAIAASNAALKTLETTVSSLQDSVTTLTSEKHLMDAKMQQRKESLQDALNQLQSLSTTLLLGQERLESLAGAKDTMNRLLTEYDTLNADKCNLRREADQILAKLDELDTLLITIQKNVSVKNAVNRFHSAKAKLESMTQAADPAKIQQVIESFDATRSLLDQAKSRLNASEGQLKGIAEYLNEFNQERKHAKYENVQQRYLEAKIEHRLRADVLEDIFTYVNALDNSLMQFHARKLTEINGILKEYWRIMYKGNDIEYIALQSDTETQITRGTGLRSYNYRMVMCVRGVEIDMRGRCSAGQKVLACIIVRLALAECFCDTCGLLTLDEPTTNLDRANIIGLGSALGSLISHRKENKSFQLIIITHDETFVGELAKHQVTERVLNVYKDAAGHSRIREINLASYS